MALAATILDVIERGGVIPPATSPYSWLSKGVGTGVNKHTIWILAIFLWRIFK